MILVELTGGLGNQLFQYAAGFSLAQHHKVALKVNPNSFSAADLITGTQRKFELRHFQQSPIIATQEEINSFLQQSVFQKALEKLLPFHRRHIYKEKEVTFDSHFFKAKNDVYLKGNRQSEQYFFPYKDELRSALQINQESIKNVQHRAIDARSQESVALHIRRGDYLTNIAMDVLGLIPVEHYKKAYSLLKEKTKIACAYIFSDDIEWAKDNLSLPVDMKFISQSAIEDFYLISQCKHQIIANSTFSWWAAWLNPNPDKIVIAPKKWFNNALYDTRDLIPDSWIKM
jgi:hypothetical protein